MRYANAAAEQFFDSGAATLCGRARRFPRAHSPLFALVDSVWRNGNSVSEYDMRLDMPRIGSRS